MNWSCKLTLWQRERDGGGGQPPVKSEVRAQSNTVSRLQFFWGEILENIRVDSWGSIPHLRKSGFLLAWGFPESSNGKESTCNAGDLGSVPDSGRSPGEGIGYPLQYSWASLVAQLVKNLPSMWETWIQSLGWEDPLEKGKATHSSILAWRSCKESDTTEQLSLALA